VHIQLQNISKRYIYDWIIKDLSYTFAGGSITGVDGINGSGKSTLIKIISGWLSPSVGSINYLSDNIEISRSEIFKHVSIVAPYTDVIQEFDLTEMYDFHVKFKALKNIPDFDKFQSVVRVKKHSGKPLQYYSSGMKQRVQLALAILSETGLLLLDEPTAYLDKENKKWFYDLLSKNMNGRTVIISSNDMEDFQFCENVLNLK